MGHRGAWWVLLLIFTAFGVVGVMAVRTLDRADRERGRTAELERMQSAWQDHLDRHSPTR